jgi:hypothetical protein
MVKVVLLGAVVYTSFATRAVAEFRAIRVHPFGVVPSVPLKVTVASVALAVVEVPVVQLSTIELLFPVTEVQVGEVPAAAPATMVGAFVLLSPTFEESVVVPATNKSPEASTRNLVLLPFTNRFSKWPPNPEGAFTPNMVPEVEKVVTAAPLFT